ncbi:MAG: RNA polymerase sigma factor [Maricaulaceae bacterium]
MSSGHIHKHDTRDVRRALAAMAATEDAAAFACLYSLCHAEFVRLAYRLCGNQEAARDIVQEASITMSRKIGGLKDPSAFNAWAYRIIRYRVQDYFRRVERRPETPLLEDCFTTSCYSNLEVGLSLRQCLAKLGEADRRLLLLFYVDGLTGREMSEALGIPIGTIKSRLFAIRQRFKQIYNQEGDHDE